MRSRRPIGLHHAEGGGRDETSHAGRRARQALGDRPRRPRSRIAEGGCWALARTVPADDAVRILTVLVPDGGRASGGDRRRRRPGGVRSRIGLSGQYAAVDEHLTGFENLEWSAVSTSSGRPRSRRGSCSSASTCRAGDRPVKAYSGGMRRRLDLIRRSSGPPCFWTSHHRADPRGRASMWEIIRELVEGGTTLLLTTPVPGGRPPRRRHRGHRPAGGRRPGHRRPAEVPDRRRAGGARRRSVEHLAAVKRPRRVAVGDVVIDEQSRRVTARSPEAAAL